MELLLLMVVPVGIVAVFAIRARRSGKSWSERDAEYMDGTLPPLRHAHAMRDELLARDPGRSHAADGEPGTHR